MYLCVECVISTAIACNFFILVQELFSFIQIFSYLVGTFEFIKTKDVMLGSMTRFVSHITFLWVIGYRI